MFEHKIKRISFLGRKVPVLLQNENGPCPLLSLCNVLLLRGTIKVHENRDVISTDQVVALIADHLLESNPPLMDESLANNQSQSLNDVIQMLPLLQHGLDVNIRFNHVSDFEFNASVALFDMLDVHLYHGWIIDPQDEVTHTVVSPLSYNQLVEKSISKETEDSMICSNFLQDNASQLTYFGLLKLHEVVGERQLAVFFRNNHFSTLFKLDGHLYMLVTDQGYQLQDAVAWECLTEIDGNTELVSPEFGDPNQYVPMELLLSEHANTQSDLEIAEKLQRQILMEAESVETRQPQVSHANKKSGCIVS